MLASVSASMPVRRPPMSASPESLSRMRLSLGVSAIGGGVYNGERLAASAERATTRCSPLAARLFHIRHHFAGKVVATLLNPLAQLVADEASHAVRAAGVLAGGLQVVAHILLVVADVRLLQQT